MVALPPFSQRHFLLSLHPFLRENAAWTTWGHLLRSPPRSMHGGHPFWRRLMSDLPASPFFERDAGEIRAPPIPGLRAYLFLPLRGIGTDSLSSGFLYHVSGLPPVFSPSERIALPSSPSFFHHWRPSSPLKDSYAFFFWADRRRASSTPLPKPSIPLFLSGAENQVRTAYPRCGNSCRIAKVRGPPPALLSLRPETTFFFP